VIDTDTGDHAHAAPGERLLRLLRRLRMERSQQARRGLDQGDRQAVELELPKVLLEHAVDEFAQPARGLDAGRSPAHDDDRQVGPRAAGGDFGAGVLERRQQARAQPDRVVQGLERHRVLIDAGDAEAGRHRAGGDDQVVVLQRDLGIDGHGSAVEVDRGHRAEHEPRRFRAAQNAANGEADVAGIKTRRCHLVQQRLKRVEVVGIDDGHVDGRTTQSLDDAQATKPGPDDDNVRSHCVSDHGSHSQSSKDSRRGMTTTVPSVSWWTVTRTP
jgi:hypothetical protein